MAGQKIEDLDPAKLPYLNQGWHDVGEACFMAEDRDLNSRFLAAHPSMFAFAYSEQNCELLDRCLDYTDHRFSQHVASHHWHLDRIATRPARRPANVLQR